MAIHGNGPLAIVGRHLTDRQSSVTTVTMQSKIKTLPKEDDYTTATGSHWNKLSEVEGREGEGRGVPHMPAQAQSTNEHNTINTRPRTRLKLRVRDLFRPSLRVRNKRDLNEFSSRESALEISHVRVTGISVPDLCGACEISATTCSGQTSVPVTTSRNSCARPLLFFIAFHF